MKIYLIGVYHIFQTERHDNFMEYLKKTCESYQIKSIGEEMSIDALGITKAKESTVKAVADQMGIAHSYCDPGDADRQDHNILGENELLVKTWFDNSSNDEASSRKADNFKKREEWWLKRIKECYVDPMLFVCGMAHTNNFASILRQKGFCCDILVQWDLSKTTNKNDI